VCDLAFINLLREKVHHRETEDTRAAAFGKSPSERFVPWILPSPAAFQAAPETQPEKTPAA
jgi:hypothetical protein